MAESNYFRQLVNNPNDVLLTLCQCCGAYQGQDQTAVDHYNPGFVAYWLPTKDVEAFLAKVKPEKKKQAEQKTTDSWEYIVIPYDDGENSMILKRNTHGDA